MLHRVVNKIVPILKTLNFSDVVGGIARTIKQDVDGTEKSYPVYYESDLTTCQTQSLQPLTPDGGEKTVMYFEIISPPRVTVSHREYNEFESIIRLVCWVNYEKINSSLYEPSSLITNILKVFPEKITDDLVKGVNISFNSQAFKEELFTKYTYNEKETQFATHPYDAFGLDFDVQFRLSPDCAVNITIDPACGH